MAEILKEILADSVKSVAASNQPIFKTDIDYDAEFLKNQNFIEKWRLLSDECRVKYKDQSVFLTENGCIDLNDQSVIPSKNFSKLKKEISARIFANDTQKLLSLDSVDIENALLEIAESIENAGHIKELYRLRKKTTGISKNSGISSEEGARLKNCFSQGRELYIAGKNGSLMVKPLNFFYALTAYSYGVIVLNNPIRFNKGNIPGSHGLSYLPDSIQIQFGGDIARGTFSDLVTSFPTNMIKNRNLEINQDLTDSVLTFYQNRFDVSLGTLLSMVPEMAEYYKLITGKNSRAYPLEIVSANDPRSLKWEFQIGDGEHRPDAANVEVAFLGFSVSERYGKFVVSVAASESHKVKACIYTDIKGKFWYIDNPLFPIVLPEICIHFLITNIFSNIMRYRPDEWGSVLLNEVSSGTSLLTRHYFSSFQQKFFFISLRAISQYFPYVV